MNYSRRDFGKLALGSIPLGSAVLSDSSLFAADKPNSRFNGVLVGAIIPYSFHNMPSDAQSLLNDMIEAGLSGCEMQSPPAEQFAGAPVPAGRGGGPAGPGAAGGPAGAGGGAGRGPGGAGAPPPTPEQLAAQKAAADAMTKWRLSAPMDKFVELRKMYNDAGVTIYGFKLQLTETMPDAEYDYTFNAAKAVGANQVTMELPESADLTKRIGDFAAKHKMMVGYHAHAQSKMTAWDQAMSQSKYNGINMDIGHYTAAGNHDAIEFIKKNHERIASIHFKDRKFPENGGQNVPWGQGDTPVKQALQLMRDQKYAFPASIELEYTLPAGSDSLKEVANCLQYAKMCLTS